MITGFLTIGLLQTLAVIAPGPDFAIVVKNTLNLSRRAGILTTLGITCGVLFHLSYCLLGLAILLHQYPFLFTLVKFLGCGYLIYIGFKEVFHSPTNSQPTSLSQKTSTAPCYLSYSQAFRQGLFCNMLNPKAALFFISLFTLVISPNTSHYIQLSYGFEILLITFIWFISLSFLLSHQQIAPRIRRFQGVISKAMGILLIFFGARLAFVCL
jgi:RhtB (resistance to homoserine/threonine) family protein